MYLWSIARIGKSNGLFHRLLRPPCRSLPATCMPPARQRGSGGLASMGRQAAGPADWGWVVAVG